MHNLCVCYPSLQIADVHRIVTYPANDSYLPTIPKFPGLYRKIGLHPGIPEIFHKSWGSALVHGLDARAFGLPVARIMRGHII